MRYILYGTVVTTNISNNCNNEPILTSHLGNSVAGRYCSFKNVDGWVVYLGD